MDPEFKPGLPEEQTEPKNPKRLKVRLFKKHVSISSSRAIAFVIIFAAIGSYFIFSSFAATEMPPSANNSNMPTYNLPDPAIDHASGQILLRFKPGVSEAAQRTLLNRYAAKPMSEITQIKVKQISVPEEALDAIIEALSHNPAVDFAEKDLLLKPVSTTPNDPIPEYLKWGLVQTHMPEAWDISKGNTNVVVAILDSGVELTQPDLKNRLVPGYDIFNNDSDPSDDFGHGTGVAGVAGAETNNSLGVASYCWTCSIMPIKITGSDGYALWSTMAKGLTYSADHGAKIANMSFAGTAGSSTLLSAIQYAKNKNMVVFAAAGNSGTTTQYYPAAYPEVVSVGATAENNLLDTYSNYGSWVDVAAPGCNASTHRSTSTNIYGGFCGTSSASPAAAGIAALAWSYKPTATNTQIEDALYKGAVLGSLQVTYGRVDAYNTLQVLAGQPLPPADTTPPTTSITRPTTGTSVSGSLAIDATASDNVSVTSVEIIIDGTIHLLNPSSTTSTYSFYVDTTKLTNGLHTMVSRASDAAGNAGTSVAVSINITNGVGSDTAAPVVTINSPANGAIIGSRVTISGSATDNVAVTAMEVYIDGVLNGSSTTGSISKVWNTRKAASGTHTITVKAYDARGNVGTQNITVTK